MALAQFLAADKPYLFGLNSSAPILYLLIIVTSICYYHYKNSFLESNIPHTQRRYDRRGAAQAISL